MSRAWAVVKNGTIVNIIVADEQHPNTVPVPVGRTIGDPVGPHPRDNTLTGHRLDSTGSE